jgi:molybdate transport system substrate-binding protein
MLIRACLCIALSLFGTSVWSKDLTVFAASSLKSVFDALIPEFEGQSGSVVTAVYASSSTLARQIEQGAPADVFVSANSVWMDVLEDQGRIKASSRRDVIGNDLVIVSGLQDVDALALNDKDSVMTELLSKGLAMGMVTAVPAGIYGKQALDYYGLWEGVSDAVIQADSVRSALTYVALGEVGYGIVYASDALADPRVEALATFPPHAHDAIFYPAAVVTDTKTAGAIDFVEFLGSQKAQDIFVSFGFRSLP